MAHKDIEDMLDQLRRIKNRGDLDVGKTDHIETLEMELRFLRTFIKCGHVVSPDALVKITKKAKSIVEMLHLAFGEYKTLLNVERLVSALQEFNEGNTSLIHNFELNGSYLLEYMDYLDQNLNDALRCLVRPHTFYTDTISILQKTDRCLRQVKIIRKKMRFLRYLYGAEINSYVDHEKLEGLDSRIKFLADNVGQFCLAIWVYKYGNDTSGIKSTPPYLLFLVVLAELEMKKIFLCELMASKFNQSRTFKEKKLPKGFSHHLHSLLVYLRNKKLENIFTNVSAQSIGVAIEFLLVFLGDVPNHVINGKTLNEVSEKIGVLLGDILCVFQMQLLAESTIKDDASKIDLSMIHILEKIEDLKAQVEERYYKSLVYSPSQFPTAGGLSFLDSLLRKLNVMLKSETGLDFMMKPHIGILEKELTSLTSVFRDVAKVQYEHDILKDLRVHTINLAYEAEIAIDSIFAQYNALWHLFCSLPAILKEIKHIHTEVTRMWSENLACKPCSVVEPSKHLPTQHSNLMNDEEIVGFENDTKRIIQHLILGTKELDVIPIVGMGGQGKTTCARKLYNGDIIVSHFDVRVWCIISQTYNRRELLQEIFSQVPSSKDKGDKDDSLADKLRKSLMGKRYLIVLDDMWDCMAWDDLRLCFPDVGNRSRIVVTTRLEKVGEHVKRYTDLYFLPFLTPDESCRLLHKKVFQKEDCPPELQVVSQAVAKRCKGLPLVIILVAGIIKKKKMEASWWHEVKMSLVSFLDESEGYSLSSMKLSYDNLPDKLRPCLLYMGMFPEDVRIPVSKLISLWIAEGFVQDIESGRLEETAENYLMDLISSNVVMVSKREYNGKVKHCKVHDVVLHFCLEKSREEKFMLAVKSSELQFQPSHWKGSRVSFSFSNELSKTRKPFHQNLRSLITTSQGKNYNWDPFHQCVKLRLLKILDLSSHRVQYFSSGTLQPLIHLKYSAVFTETFCIPEESHLLHLETLIVKSPSSETELPTSFWKMEKLRHVDITCAYSFSTTPQYEVETSKLENMKILRHVSLLLDDIDCFNLLAQRCPNLQELEISVTSDSSESDEKDDVRFGLASFTQLQILDLNVDKSLDLCGLYLPSNLKKFVLSANSEKSFFLHCGTTKSGVFPIMGYSF